MCVASFPVLCNHVKREACAHCRVVTQAVHVGGKGAEVYITTRGLQ